MLYSTYHRGFGGPWKDAVLRMLSAARLTCLERPYSPFGELGGIPWALG